MSIDTATGVTGVQGPRLLDVAEKVEVGIEPANSHLQQSAHQNLRTSSGPSSMNSASHRSASPGSQRSPHSSQAGTIAEAAEHLRCKRQRVDDLLSSGRLQPVKDGTRTLIRRGDLAAYLDGGERRTQ